MRMMAGWIALTPELAVKLEMAKQVYEDALHTDALGKRLPELRAQPQVSKPPNEAFVTFMNAIEDKEEWEDTIERLVGIYRVLKPHLISHYSSHLSAMNPVYEPPTLRILERLVEEEKAHVERGSVLLERVARLEGKASARRELAIASRRIARRVGRSDRLRSGSRTAAQESRTQLTRSMKNAGQYRPICAKRSRHMRRRSRRAIAQRREASRCPVRSRPIGRRRRKLRESRSRSKSKRSRWRRSASNTSRKSDSATARRCAACSTDGAKRPTASG